MLLQINRMDAKINIIQKLLHKSKILSAQIRVKAKLNCKILRSFYNYSWATAPITYVDRQRFFKIVKFHLGIWTRINASKTVIEVFTVKYFLVMIHEKQLIQRIISTFGTSPLEGGGVRISKRKWYLTLWLVHKRIPIGRLKKIY